MTGLFAYLMLLPFATWWLGNALSVLDGAPVAAVCRRTAWRTLPFIAVAAWLGPSAMLPMAGALVTALALHALWQWSTTAAVRRGWSSADRDDTSPAN